MSAQRDYYEVLGLGRSASGDDIKSAYRKLARELHPDVNKASDAADRFSQLQEAYDVLSDEQKRRNYDRFGHAGPSPFGPSGGSGGPTYSWSNVAGQRPGQGGDFDLGSMFEEILSGRGSAPFSVGAKTRARSRPTRGKDINQEFAVDFLTAAAGGKRSIRVRRGGSTQTIEVTIPPGTNEGAKLRIRGAGSPSPGSAPPGDLILTINIAPHPYFKRDADKVLIELPISITEAALGAHIHVPTLNGKRAEVRVPPGSTSGLRLRLRGQGIQPREGPPGDLYVQIKIVAPEEVSERDKAILEDIAKRLPTVRTDDHWTD